MRSNPFSGIWQRWICKSKAIGGTIGHNVPSVLTGTGAEIDDKVRTLDHLLIVLDYDESISEIPEILERADELNVVALMEADAGLIQDVKHPNELRADLSGQSDTLSFPTREAPRRTIQGKIIESHVQEKS